MLNVVKTGETGQETGPALVIAHGLFGSARNWGVLSKRLADQRPVLTVDMRNHGYTAWQSTQTYNDMANDLAEIIENSADVLGHSMGGKAAMMLALSQPAKVRRLIVADIAPVAYSHTQMHLIKAMQAIDLSTISSRRDADMALKADIPEMGVRAFLLQSLDLQQEIPRWRFNLDILAASMDDIIGFPSVDAQFDGPVLFLTGGASDYVSDNHRPRILELFPNAEFLALEGAGHWLHAEKPREFEAAMRAFLN